jgi:hypothetical protein
MVTTCQSVNPSGELRQKEWESQASLSYNVRPCLKKNKTKKQNLKNT